MYSIYWMNKHDKDWMEEKIYHTIEEVKEKLELQGYRLENGWYRREEKGWEGKTRALITTFEVMPLSGMALAKQRKREETLEEKIKEIQSSLEELAQKANNTIFFKKKLIAELKMIISKTLLKEERKEGENLKSQKEMDYEITIHQVRVGLEMLKEMLQISTIVDNTFHRTLRLVIKEMKKEKR